MVAREGPVILEGRLMTGARSASVRESLFGIGDTEQATCRQKIGFYRYCLFGFPRVYGIHASSHEKGQQRSPPVRGAGYKPFDYERYQSREPRDLTRFS